MNLTRFHHRYADKMRVTGALMMLLGVVGLVDVLLPQPLDGILDDPVGFGQWPVPLAALLLGAILFRLGRRTSPGA